MPVYKDKERGTWYYDFTKTINGVAYKRKKRGFLSKTEALLAEQNAIKNLGQEPKEKNADLTLDEVFDIYLLYRNTKNKITSITASKKRYKNHIQPFFGNTKVKDINNKDLFTWKVNFLKNDFSESFSNMIIGEFKRLLDFALKKEYINNNSLVDELDKVTLNKIIPERNVLTFEQIDKFLNSFLKEDDPIEYDYWLYFYAFAYSGMRPNEFRALQVKDIQGDYLCVNKTINSEVKRKADLLQTPKNVNSNRKVIMPHEIIELLLEHTKGYEPNDFIFGKTKAFRQTSLNRKLELHLKVAGLPRIVLYGFRHSHATNLIKAGVPIKVVSKRLGHKNASTTMNVYWHLFQEDETQVLDVLKRKEV